MQKDNNLQQPAEDHAARTRRELETTYSAKFKKYKGEEATSDRVFTILDTREQKGKDAFDREMVGVSIAELMNNEHTPAGLKSFLESYLTEIARHTGVYGWREASKPDAILEWFGLALDVMQEEGEPVNIAGSLINALVEAIILIMNSPLTPEIVSDSLHAGLDALADRGESNTSMDAALLRSWFPRCIERLQAEEAEDDD